MAYRIDCECPTCEEIRAESFIAYCEVAESILDYHGYGYGPEQPVIEGDDVISHLATELMIAADLVEGYDHYEDAEDELRKLTTADALARELDDEYRRLFGPADNVVPFKARARHR